MNEKNTYDVQLTYKIPVILKDVALEKIENRFPPELKVTFSRDKNELIFQHNLPEIDEIVLDDIMFEDEALLQDFIDDLVEEIAGPIEDA